MSTTEHIRARLSQLAGALSSQCIQGRWQLRTTLRRGRGELEDSVNLRSLKLLLLQLEEGMKPLCFRQQWHDTPGNHYALSHTYVAQLRDQLCLQTENFELPRDFFTSRPMEPEVMMQNSSFFQPPDDPAAAEAHSMAASYTQEVVTVTGSGRGSVKVKRANESPSEELRYTRRLGGDNDHRPSGRRKSAGTYNPRAGYAEWQTNHKDIDEATMTFNGHNIRVVLCRPPVSVRLV